MEAPPTPGNGVRLPALGRGESYTREGVSMDDDRPETDVKYVPLDYRNSMNRVIDEAEGVTVLSTEKDKAQGGVEGETD